MFHVVLFEPEIPPNTGNAIRLCANSGATLHLVRPLGFRLDDKSLQRSGLDYHDLARVKVHANLSDCLLQLDPARLFAVETGGAAATATFNTVPATHSCSDPKRAGCRTLRSARPGATTAYSFRCSRIAAASIYPMPSRSSPTKHGGKSALPAPRQLTRPRRAPRESGSSPCVPVQCGGCHARSTHRTRSNNRRGHRFSSPAP